MDVTRTINAGMAKAARCMRNGVDNCKTDGKIAEQQKKIKALTREIGNLALVRLEAGDEMSPEIMERYAAIKEAKEAIATLESGKKKATVICQECGAKTSIDMKYCGACGTCLQEA
ncbi:MAG: hypothetical protein J6F30_05955 [Cellulosilyticum sp.]|nr:hypothetical protein [Cellulosilyticum sp.]